MAKKKKKILYRIPIIGKIICPHKGEKTPFDIFEFCCDCGKNLGTPYPAGETPGFKMDPKTGERIPVTWVLDGKGHCREKEEKTNKGDQI